MSIENLSKGQKYISNKKIRIRTDRVQNWKYKDKNKLNERNFSIAVVLMKQMDGIALNGLEIRYIELHKTFKMVKNFEQSLWKILSNG